MSLRSNLIRLASTFAVDSQERADLLDVLTKSATEFRLRGEQPSTPEDQEIVNFVANILRAYRPGPGEKSPRVKGRKVSRWGRGFQIELSWLVWVGNNYESSAQWGADVIRHRGQLAAVVDDVAYKDARQAAKALERQRESQFDFGISFEEVAQKVLDSFSREFFKPSQVDKRPNHWGWSISQSEATKKRVDTSTRLTPKYVLNMFEYSGGIYKFIGDPSLTWKHEVIGLPINGMTGHIKHTFRVHKK